MDRSAMVKRETKETAVELELFLDGGEIDISTGVGFFDHMLNSFAHHGGFGLSLKVEGDLIVDCHHTIEDTGIALGCAFSIALGNKGGIGRFGNMAIPMDEALSTCAVDISGRPYLVFQGDFPQERVGDFDTCMTEEFFRAFAENAGMTIHANCQYGKNSHHMIEALYKALGHAIKQAVIPSENGEILSTKGCVAEEMSFYEDEN